LIYWDLRKVSVGLNSFIQRLSDSAEQKMPWKSYHLG
jgi:hypothetical protein